MMKMKEILNTIKDLASSQGSYGRLFEDLKQLQESDPEEYERLAEDWEKEGFETTLDLILFLEEGKHCKRKFWKIPVTWECYGEIEVEGDTIEEALSNFRKNESEGTGYELPEGEYVDGSLRLSDDNEEELKSMITLINK